MSTFGNETSIEVRRALRKMRRLALAFHGSELRLLDRTERCAKVVHVAPARRTEAKVGAQA
jgi:hypothetical protein